MEDVFTVEEAAGILGCKRRLVYDLIANGWLARPSGGTKKETGGRVTQKSLWQFVIVDRLRGLPPRTLRELRNRRKLFEKSACANGEAKHLSIDEGQAGIEGADRTYGPDRTNGTNGVPENIESPPPSATSGLKQENPDHYKRCLHHDFAAEHQFSFGWRARQLAPNDAALQDDLVQEMSLAVLEYNKPASFEYLFELAGNRAKMYLRYEAKRGMQSLSAVQHASDKFVEKMESLNVFIDELMKRGVPVEWIEEVIGKRLDVA